MSEKNESNPVEGLIPKEQEKKLKPAKPIDYWLFALIGIAVCAFNVWITINTRDEQNMWWIWSYLIIIFLVLIPDIIFAVSKRARGYGYIIGYLIGGAYELIFGDPFIGGYFIVVTIFLFLIVYLIFWKVWRSFSKFKFK